ERAAIRRSRLIAGPFPYEILMPPTACRKAHCAMVGGAEFGRSTGTPPSPPAGGTNPGRAVSPAHSFRSPVSGIRRPRRAGVGGGGGEDPAAPSLPRSFRWQVLAEIRIDPAVGRGTGPERLGSMRRWPR